MKSLPLRMIGVLIIFLCMAVFVGLLFKSQSKKYSGMYTFIYPSQWVVETKDNAIFIAPVPVLPESDEAPRGKIEIRKEELASWFRTDIYAQQTYSSVDEFLRATKSDEAAAIKSGQMPVAPGPGSIEIVGDPTITLPKGFREIESITTIGAPSQSHLYWGIRPGYLYTIYIQYPLDASAAKDFEAKVAAILRSLSI